MSELKTWTVDDLMTLRAKGLLTGTRNLYFEANNALTVFQWSLRSNLLFSLSVGGEDAAGTTEIVRRLNLHQTIYQRPLTCLPC